MINPLRIEGLKDIDFISCGSSPVICKSYSGDIFSWGCNIRGQLGINTTGYEYEPVKCDN